MSDAERAELPERWTVAEGAGAADGAGDTGDTEEVEPDVGATPPDPSPDGGREAAGRPPAAPDADGAPGPSRRERIDRSRARAWALQILYRWETGGMRGSLPEALEETRRTRRVAPRRVPRIGRLLDLLDDRLPEVDRAIDGALDNWRLERLSRIDRAVLRIGAAELLFLDDIPPRASIQEAVRLADQYGGDESARFVNGVLDALYHR